MFGSEYVAKWGLGLATSAFVLAQAVSDFNPALVGIGGVSLIALILRLLSDRKGEQAVRDDFKNLIDLLHREISDLREENVRLRGEQKEQDNG